MNLKIIVIVCAIVIIKFIMILTLSLGTLPLRNTSLATNPPTSSTKITNFVQVIHERFNTSNNTNSVLLDACCRCGTLTEAGKCVKFPSQPATH